MNTETSPLTARQQCLCLAEFCEAHALYPVVHLAVEMRDGLPYLRIIPADGIGERYVIAYLANALGQVTGKDGGQ